MYRLLIVDDEAVIADGLFEIFGRFELALDICKAYSGLEALEIMKRNRVDIVLTDIRMPGMDGIQLMEQIRRDWSHCKIIFLTGYNDFDYIYQAIQSPGVSYILKTEGYRKVKDMVRTAVEQLDDELYVKDLVQRSQERLNTLETLLQGEYMRYVMKGSRSVDQLKIDFERLNIQLDPDKGFRAILGVLDISSKKDSYVDRQEAALAVKFLADTFLQDKVNHISVLDRYNDVLWLVQPSEEIDANTGAAVRYLEGIFELIEQASAESLNIALSVTLAENWIEWKALSTVYEKLRQLQTVRVGDGAHMVQTVYIKETVDLSRSGSASQRSSVENAELLIIHLESGRREEFLDMLEGIIDTINEETDPAFAIESYYSIALVLLSQLNRLHLTDKVNVKGLMNFDEHVSWTEGYAYLKQTAELLFAYRQTGEKKRAAQAMDQVRHYIEEHLHEDLSLVRLAEMIHFNPSYLSRLFKQECNVNLSEYIEECRVKKAKELLRTHNYKIAEIGAKVGYATPHSFTRFFKKLTGLAPQEYRDGKRDMGD